MVCFDSLWLSKYRHVYFSTFWLQLSHIYNTIKLYQYSLIIHDTHNQIVVIICIISNPNNRVCIHTGQVLEWKISFLPIFHKYVRKRYDLSGRNEWSKYEILQFFFLTGMFVGDFMKMVGCCDHCTLLYFSLVHVLIVMKNSVYALLMATRQLLLNNVVLYHVW